MNNLTKLRLLHSGVGFGFLVSIFGLIGVLFLNGELTVTNTETGNVNVYDLRTWFTSTFLFPPIAYFVGGMAAAFTCVVMYAKVYGQTDQQRIDDANMRVVEFGRRHWWKFLLGALVFSIVFVEVLDRLFLNLP